MLSGNSKKQVKVNHLITITIISQLLKPLRQIDLRCYVALRTVQDTYKTMSMQLRFMAADRVNKVHGVNTTKSITIKTVMYKKTYRKRQKHMGKRTQKLLEL